ncbi:thiol reductant ABC exporter subunit CydD [Metabacillus rhizolycopersici]|uniref:Thiol reductant ABC exporter subunit CydD n=1 Tax=Metabacillus rhizolycopersici TaxID=2875709 RepID=A0ABS7ULM5_9BACI|nr:thiol reductant ABC exporter subunit CydD [Metabacillus rhizolycopersici]MBZ5749226.1 thiol reductant ABC exporter subunit CydD [Metabacillus rhizolycopersici]
MNGLKEIAREQSGVRALLILSSILIGATVIAQAFYFVTIVDMVFLKEKSFQEIIPFLIGLLLVLIGRAVLTYVNGKAGVKMAAKVMNEIRKELVSKYISNPVQASLKGQSGKKVSVMMDAVDEIDGYFSKYVPQVIQTSIVPLMILVVVFSQHIYSGLIMVVTAPFIPLFMAIVGSKTKKKSEEQMEKLSAFSGRFLDVLQGLTTIKLFGRTEQQKILIQKSSLGFRDITMEVLKVAFVSTLMLEFISMLSIGLIALEVGLRLVVFKGITFYKAFLILVLAPEFYLSLKELGSAFHTGRGSMGAANKIFEELAVQEQMMKWGEGSLRQQNKPPAIELRGVGFCYGAEGFAIHDIDATIPPFSQVAIVGRSGSGKTTLLHLIAGLVGQNEGEILIAGKAMKSYKESNWFNCLSYISQHPYLFSGTIADNISIGGNEMTSRAEVEKAAEKAGIAEMITQLENGYDTHVGEGGRGLSGGEKQRIAIARAFLKKPSIILFDEPTTGLDLQTERILQASMKELALNSTVITVAHRLYTIKNADNILFLDNGKLVASGTHNELLDLVPDYREMVTIQTGGGK